MIKDMSRDYTYAQHFLKNPRVVAELIGHSNIRKNDTVYDLGAGSGVITSVLARRCKQVIAVEIEQHALKKLHTNTAGLNNVTIVGKDITELDIKIESYKIFANIPFNLSSVVVRTFTESNTPPKTMYLIVQKQFARKLVPGNDHFTSLLSAQIGPWFSARIRKPLRKTDFTPPPAVDTVLLEIKKREVGLLDKNLAATYREFTERCFAEQKFFSSLDRAAATISSEKTPSQISLDEWLRLFATTSGR
jgi:16S rRNA A1518/A1519 N6-dimethyltransferase RsmA/KsgA/DIM1 with predicted DNA glycosylase/AP lyase activity